MTLRQSLLLAVQAAVVAGLVVLVYLTFLKPEPDRPLFGIDAPRDGAPFARERAGGEPGGSDERSGDPGRRLYAGPVQEGRSSSAASARASSAPPGTGAAPSAPVAGGGFAGGGVQAGARPSTSGGGAPEGSAAGTPGGDQYLDSLARIEARL